MNRNKLFKICYGALLVVFLISGLALLVGLAVMHQSDEFYQQLLERTEKSDTLDEGDVTKYAEQSIIQHRLFLAQKGYPGMAAWLQIKGTSIDYPVMLGEDNQFYLEHLPDGSENALGSLFFDYRTNKNSRHLIIYGHNGAGGNMFGSLKRYESADYFAKHPEIILATVEDEYICPIFSVQRVSAEDAVYSMEFEDTEDLMNYVKETSAQSHYPIDIPDGTATCIVTLSTCTERNNQRLIVQALMFCQE